MEQLISEKGRAQLQEMAVTLAKEMGMAITKLVPSVHGVCVTFSADVPMPGVIVCAEGRVNSDTLLELIASNCQQVTLLTHKMLGKDEDGRLDKHGQDRPPLGREGEAAPLPDGSAQPTDSEVHGEDHAAEGDSGEQD